MDMTNQQQEILQKLQELNAASHDFDAADSILKKVDQHAAHDSRSIAEAERAKAIEQYVAAKEWLYAHTNDVVYDSKSNAFMLRHLQNVS